MTLRRTPPTIGTEQGQQAVGRGIPPRGRRGAGALLSRALPRPPAPPARPDKPTRPPHHPGSPHLRPRECFSKVPHAAHDEGESFVRVLFHGPLQEERPPVVQQPTVSLVDPLEDRGLQEAQLVLDEEEPDR